MTHTFDLVTYTEVRFEEVEDPDFTGHGKRGAAVALTVSPQIALLVARLTLQERVDMLRGRKDEADGID